MHESIIAEAVRDPKFLARFWSKVDKSGECWNWTGCRFSVRGAVTHGNIGIRVRARYWRTVGAHRVAWTEAHGQIPDGACVLHRCDNMACVRADHLFLGTVADNNRDKAEKGRAPRAFCEDNGSHKLTRADVERIRSLHREGVATSALAESFGVLPSTIRKKLVGHRVFMPVNQYG